MDNTQKINFLYQSISDTQATIRAVDVKVGFLFVVIFLPFTKFEEILNINRVLYEASPYLVGLTFIIVITWLAAIASLFSCTVSISNPGKNIAGNIPKGMFFCDSLFKMNFCDNFFNFSKKSNLSISQFINQLPSSESDIIGELTFEKMKLTYIRDIKLKRSSFCVLASFTWVITGCVACILYFFKVGA